MRLPVSPSEKGVETVTDKGTVEGFEWSDGKSSFHVYLGIPYASPPIGELRFKKPVPAEPWQGVRKCRKFAARSVQKDMFWDKVVTTTRQSEDCLYLNVFSPPKEEGKKYPVLFYIHGGGFMMDSPAKYDYKDTCKQLVDKGVIVVTIQYRLGFLGFFCLSNDVCKGNFGMWDQLMALEWTKRNISSFGGDESLITVGGQSAGGVSADLLSLSPYSRDLFQRKITMGGSSFCHWAVSKPEKISEFCRRKARKLGWKGRKEREGEELMTPEEEDEAMMEFLRTVPADKFGCHMIGTSEVFNEARLPLSPVIDGDFLPRSLSLLRLEAPHKPTIGGVGEYEALLFVALGLLRCNGKFLDKVMGSLAKESRGGSIKEIQEAVRYVYGDYEDKKNISRVCVTLLSDIISNYAAYRQIQWAQYTNTPLYMYSLDFTSRNMWGWMKAVIPFCEKRGTHASELLYLFKCNYFVAPLPMDKDDKIIADIMPRLFMNFVKNGDPNSDETREKNVVWEPVDEDRKQMLSIGPSSTMKREAFEGRLDRLDQFFRRYHLDGNYQR